MTVTNLLNNKFEHQSSKLIIKGICTAAQTDSGDDIELLTQPRHLEKTLKELAKLSGTPLSKAAREI
ncbi:hypothetical protein, partial [uncultured Rubinisphaera sp.]|uniref:hypothetical protein n=1 Tax=uncultured Rubinisphaera sp. TaxID=1678686 RepID=UPI0030D6E280